jgi:hypothetical protein
MVLLRLLKEDEEDTRTYFLQYLILNDQTIIN